MTEVVGDEIRTCEDVITTHFTDSEMRQPVAQLRKRGISGV